VGFKFICEQKCSVDLNSNKIKVLEVTFQRGIIEQNQCHLFWIFTTYCELNDHYDLYHLLFLNKNSSLLTVCCWLFNLSCWHVIESGVFNYF